ncbi:MAG: hypothetical protein IKJ27_00270 [Clostridia bacterium]|nr:hypothetical protein [Clostridia bacterium]
MGAKIKTLNLTSAGVSTSGGTTVSGASWTTGNLKANGGSETLKITIDLASIFGEYSAVTTCSVSFNAKGDRKMWAAGEVTSGYYTSSSTVQKLSGNVAYSSDEPSSHSWNVSEDIKKNGKVELYITVKNPIAALTNKFYFTNISITVAVSTPDYTITTVASPTEGGTVSGGGTYESGKSVSLTATANEGYSFSGWSDGNTSNPRSVTVTANATYTAIFTLNKINNIYVNTVKPKDIYFDDSNIVFVVDGEIPTLPSSLYDTVDGYHLKVQNTVSSGMTKCKHVYKDLVKVYG